MAIINSYAAGTVTTSDLILGVDTSSNENTTKTFTAGEIASLASGSTAYNSYVALLTNTGAVAPAATVLSNNLTATLTWARTFQGTYTLTASAATFTANKTIVFVNPGSNTGSIITWTRTSDTVLTITARTTAGQASDGIIADGAFEVRIYS